MASLETVACTSPPPSRVLPEWRASNWTSCKSSQVKFRFICGRADTKVFSYETQDGLYDLAWSEVHENQILTASGDGSLKLWDVTLNVSS